MNGTSERSEESPVSLVVSLVSLALMCFGLINMIFNGDSFSLPGIAAVAMHPLISLQPAPLGLSLASTGVLLLGLLPAIRVLLAVWLYMRSRNLFGTMVAVVVLLELMLSIRLGS
jgi:uncharacterized membrane protein